MTKTFESLSTSFTLKRNVSLDVNHETPPVGFDPSPSLTEIEASLSRFAPVYANTLEQTGLNPEAFTPFVDTSDRMRGGSGEQYLDEQIGQEQVIQEQIVQEILAGQFDTYKISPSLPDERSLDSTRRVCRMSEELEFLAPRSHERPWSCENRNICFSQMTMAGIFPHPPALPLADLPFREDLNRIRAGNHRWDDLSYSRVRLAHDKLDIWDSEYWAAEKRCATAGIHAFYTPSIPIRPRKSRRLSEVSNRSEAEVTADLSAIVVIEDSEDNTEGVSLPSQEETPTVKDGSQKIPSGTDAANMQRADDASARGSVPGESNELKSPGDASRSKEKGKVDPVDKKAEKKRIAAKAKADLEAGRIPAFRISGTCEVLLSEAPAAQSLVSHLLLLFPSVLNIDLRTSILRLVINTGKRIVSAYE
ncbi:hypothetical protein AALP_AA2G094300 [Arabis alpina]|uniref:Uncharacterized protein n=1 Tax=Arabis alpina TaxID=50452 RepID=A0A087HGB3_ARAAL|nr:hypothetical protein AALP_AA2G094300 [Arabis alpina]